MSAISNINMLLLRPTFPLHSITILLSTRTRRLVVDIAFIQTFINPQYEERIRLYLDGGMKSHTWQIANILSESTDPSPSPLISRFFFNFAFLPLTLKMQFLWQIKKCLVKHYLNCETFLHEENTLT